MTAQIAILLGCVLAAFSGGWVVASWKYSSDCLAEKNEVLVTDVQQETEKLAHLRNKLTEVIEEASDLSVVTSAVLGGMSEKVAERNAALGVLEVKTKAISREISKLDNVSYVLPSVYARMYREIGEAANSDRHALYGSVH